jgi:hypothetical protein
MGAKLASSRAAGELVISAPIAFGRLHVLPLIAAFFKACRVVFNVAIGNRDDHLRNHGFLPTPTGWRLAPAFDLNPDTDRLGLYSAGRSRFSRQCVSPPDHHVQSCASVSRCRTAFLRSARCGNQQRQAHRARGFSRRRIGRYAKQKDGRRRPLPAKPGIGGAGMTALKRPLTA